MSDAPAVIVQVLALAEGKYADNPTIAAIAKHLTVTRTMAESAARDHSDVLRGYRRGMAGDMGYAQLNWINKDLFGPLLKEAGLLHEVAIITDVLAVALRALGENIEE